MLHLEAAGSVSVLRLDHGKVNALDVELLETFGDRLEELATDGVDALVLTGNGRVFSAGVDLARVVGGGTDYVDPLIVGLDRVFTSLFAFPAPVVAAVEGAAIAGGCILACAADRRLMAAGKARIGASELSVGVAFPVAALEVLRYAYGPHAEEAVFTARLLGVEEAHDIGLVHEVVEPERLVERAIEVASQLAAVPAEAYRLAKEQLRRPVLERIARDRAVVDGRVRAVWAAQETRDVLARQLERLRAAKPAVAAPSQR